MALAGYGVGSFYPFDHSEVIFRVQLLLLGQQEPDLPSSPSSAHPQGCWDGTIPGGHLVSGHVLRAGRGTCRASIPVSASDGDRSPGRGPGRGCGKLSPFLFLLSPPPSLNSDDLSDSVGTRPPGIFQPLPSPCRPWCDRPHQGSLQPLTVTLAAALSSSPSRATGRRGILSSLTPPSASPFPQLFSLPPCPDSEKKIGWISGQHPALPHSAPPGR